MLAGSNDLFDGRAGRTRLPEAFAELLDRPPGSAVATLPQPTGAAGRADQHVERAARAATLVMADLRVTSPRSWRGRLAGDFFHPNDAGYAAIATAFEPTLHRVLS